MTTDILKSTQEFVNLLFDKQVYPEDSTFVPLTVDGVAGKMTNYGVGRAKRHCEEVFRKKQYRTGENGVTMFAIRMNNKFTDLASDWFVVMTNTFLYAVPCSTKAGKYYVYNPISYGGMTGTAVLEEGQYRNTWQFVTSSNWQTLWLQTPYFNQVKPVSILRDGKLDDNVNLDSPKQVGLFGINIHTAGWNYAIWNWSAGCVVIPRIFWVGLLNSGLFQAGAFYDFTLFSWNDFNAVRNG